MIIHKKPASACNEKDSSYKTQVQQEKYAHEYHGCFPGKVVTDTSKVKQIVRGNKECQSENNEEKADTDLRMVFPVMLQSVISVFHNLFVISRSKIKLKTKGGYSKSANSGFFTVSCDL
jgi:hypothetical protein